MSDESPGGRSCGQLPDLAGLTDAFLRTVPGFYAVSFDHVSPNDHATVGDIGRYAIVE